MKLTEALQHPDKLLSSLNYISYASNRDSGMTHEALVRIRIGNEEFKTLYENGRKQN